MIMQIPHLCTVDFSPPLDPWSDYDTQTEIPRDRVVMMTACAVHFGLDFGLVVRYLAGKYTAAWRNVDLVLDDTHPHVSAETLEHMRRLLTRGAPANFNWEEPAANKLNFTRRGNSPSLIQHPVALKKTLVKEVRSSNLMPMTR